MLDLRTAHPTGHCPSQAHTPRPHRTTVFIGRREPYGATTHSFATVARILCCRRRQVSTPSEAPSYHGVLVVVDPVRTTSGDPYTHCQSDLHGLPRAH
jgi:hypothetical protein